MALVNGRHPGIFVICEQHRPLPFQAVAPIDIRLIEPQVLFSPKRMNAAQIDESCRRVRGMPVNQVMFILKIPIQAIERHPVIHMQLNLEMIRLTDVTNVRQMADFHRRRGNAFRSHQTAALIVGIPESGGDDGRR